MPVRPDRRPKPTRSRPRPATESRPIATADAIAQRAFELFQQRGGTHGSDWDDWLSAERELLSASS